MKIGFYAPDTEFANAILEELKSKLPDAVWVQWRPGTAAPNSAADVEVLFSLGPVTRELMEKMPRLVLVQTLSDGYESVDVKAATGLGIRVSYAPGDVTGNADSVAEYAVLLMLATARRLSVARASIRDRSIAVPGRGHALIGAHCASWEWAASGLRSRIDY